MSPVSVVLDELDLRRGMAATERVLVEVALQRRGGNRTHAAKDLGITRETIHRKIRKYGVVVPGQRYWRVDVKP